MERKQSMLKNRSYKAIIELYHCLKYNFYSNINEL